MSKFQVFIPANIYDGKYYDYQTYRVVVDASSEEEAKQIVMDTREEIIKAASTKRLTNGKLKVKKPAKDNMFFFNRGKPMDFYVKKEASSVKEAQQEKSWKDRMPPDGHLPASYEVQVCDEGNKTIAVQMLDKAGLKYKISARKGQFYIQAGDMQTFTQVKRVLDQSLDMAKEANHLGFPPEVTPVGTNTPQADVTAATVAVEPKPVKEGVGFQDAVKAIFKKVDPNFKTSTNKVGEVLFNVNGHQVYFTVSGPDSGVVVKTKDGKKYFTKSQKELKDILTEMQDDRELKTKRVQKNINDLSKEMNQLAKTYKNEWELQMAGSVTSEAKMHKFIDKIVKMVYDEGFDKGYAEAREIYDTSEFD